MIDASPRDQAIAAPLAKQKVLTVRLTEVFPGAERVLARAGANAAESPQVIEKKRPAW